MSRAAPVSPVNAKMYRHFAIISLTVTGCLAMFASNEQREALEGHISEKSQQREVKASEKKKALRFTDNRTTTGSFGEEAGPGQTGRSMSFETRASSPAIGPVPAAGGKGAFVSGASELVPENAVNGLPPGMTPEEILEWRRLQEKKRGVMTQDSEPSASEMAAMLTASKARSRTPGV